MCESIATTHCVIRTSPKGQPFIGKCALCGTTGLKAADALKECSNPDGVSSDDALVGAIIGGGNAVKENIFPESSS